MRRLQRVHRRWRLCGVREQQRLRRLQRRACGWVWRGASCCVREPHTDLTCMCVPVIGVPVYHGHLQWQHLLQQQRV